MNIEIDYYNQLIKLRNQCRFVINHNYIESYIYIQPCGGKTILVLGQMISGWFNSFIVLPLDFILYNILTIPILKAEKFNLFALTTVIFLALTNAFINC